MNAETIVEYLSSSLGVDTSRVQVDTPLFSSNLLDSFSIVDLISFVEQEARIRIHPSEVSLDNLDSVSRILAFVERKQAPGGGGG